MIDPTRIRESISKIEQQILEESLNYQNASQKKENLQSREEILERIRKLQKELKELKSHLK